MATRIARTLAQPTELLLIAEILNDIAWDWQDRALSVTEAHQTRDALLPLIRDVVEHVMADGAAPEQLAALSRRFLDTGIKLRLY